jgi:hypothetical protein
MRPRDSAPASRADWPPTPNDGSLPSRMRDMKGFFHGQLVNGFQFFELQEMVDKVV